jgi:hypothetical protein
MTTAHNTQTVRMLHYAVEKRSWVCLSSPRAYTDKHKLQLTHLESVGIHILQ